MSTWTSVVLFVKGNVIFAARSCIFLGNADLFSSVFSVKS